jgi:hypothetical protein
LNLDFARGEGQCGGGAGKNRKREFNSRFFPLSRGSTEIIALQAGRTNRAWNDMSDTGETNTVEETAGIEIEFF